MTQRRRGTPAQTTRKRSRNPAAPGASEKLANGRTRLALYGALAIGAVLSGLLLAWAFRGAWQSETAPNVLLITLDTVRADRLGAYGHAAARTPHLDDLARDGVLFADATAPAPITGPSHAALFTGMYPGRLGVRDNVSTPLPPEAITLAEVLAGRGYATGGFIGAFLLDRPYGFAKGFETFEGGFTRVESGREANAERRGDAVVDDALRWLSRVPAERPFFAWVHLYDPHAPYDAPEPFGSQFAHSPYDGEIAFVDHQIGRLLDALRERKLFERTLVMAIADHGESLGEHGEDEHGVFLYEGVLRIPWIVRGPGVTRGHVAAEQVRAIDLFPTILDALGIELPQAVDGESLTALLKGGTRTKVPPAYAETYYPRLHYGWSELRSVRVDGWKAIDAPRPELYHVRKDPGERQNLYEQQRSVANNMIAEATRMGREMGSEGPIAVKPPDPQTLARLRSLGYVGVAAPVPAGTRGPDPKDTIEQRREFRTLMSEAIDDLAAKRPDAAAAKLKRLVQLNSRAYDLHVLLGQAYQQMGKLEEALGEYELAALLNPDAASPRLSAAELHLARRETAAARSRLGEAADLEPHSFDVAFVTGQVLEQEERLTEALDAYGKAVEINPANPRARTQLVSLATRMQRYDLAETQLQRLLDMQYQPARTHFALGRVAQMRGQLDRAANHYREALRLEPGLQLAEEGLRRLGER